MQCQKQWEEQGLKIKSLECVKHVEGIFRDTSRATMNPRYVRAKRADLTNDKFLTNECNPEMKILSIDGRVVFTINDHENGKSTAMNNININCGLEWDKNIDAKYLYQARKQFDEMNHDDQKFKIRNNLRKNIL